MTKSERVPSRETSLNPREVSGRVLGNKIKGLLLFLIGAVGMSTALKVVGGLVGFLGAGISAFFIGAGVVLFLKKKGVR